MSTEVFNSINELKKVFAPNAHLFTVINEENISELSIAAESSRDKMIAILNQFYKDHNRNSAGVDDFVTLFGVYCNYYLLYGLHLILKEVDFGTTKIFENISDSSLKKYLSLIRSGIYKQDVTHFEEAVKTNENYSLAHFYLFLVCLRKYWSKPYDTELEKELLKHYKAIRNDELKNYAVGTSEFVPRIGNYVARLIVNYASITIDSFSIDSFFRMSNKKEWNTEENVLNNPPLPCPYLMTVEEEQRLVYLSIAFISHIFISIVNQYFVDILKDSAAKDFSETLSFIASSEQNSADINELRLRLSRFFEERKPHWSVKQLIDYGLYILPDYLEDTKEVFHNFERKTANFPILDRSATSLNQSNSEMQKIYLNEQSPIPKISDTFEQMITEPFGINSRTMIKRLFFLQIPYMIDWTNRELQNLMERISANDEKDTMVRDFMHVYSNMQASNLYDIAQLLLKRDSPEDKATGRKLLLEYAVKLELKNSVRIMQMMYKDRIGELKVEIAKSLVNEDDEHESVSDILNKSLRQCFINIFYGDPEEKASKEATLSKIHKNLENVWGKAFLEGKREQFEQQFMEPDFDCLKWLSQAGIYFTYEKKPVWEKIFMAREGFSSTFLKIIFDELLVNVFKYGDLKREIRLCLSQNESSDLVISLENHFTRTRSKSGTQIGLNLLRRRIQILHEDAKKNCVEAVEDKIKGKDGKIAKRVFRIKLRLPAALFLTPSSLH